MKLVWVVIPLVLIVSMIGIVGISESFAFSNCVVDSCSINKIANIVDIIFLGNVRSSEYNEVSFNVVKTWVGNVTENENITMVCQNYGCEPLFQLDKTYLVMGFNPITMNGQESHHRLSDIWSKQVLDATEDLEILNDSNFQTNYINNLELLKKLKETQDNGIINLIEGFTPSLIFVDAFNLELVIGLTGNLTQEDAEYYETQLKEIVGDIPMNVGFSSGLIREDVLKLERIYAPLKQIKDGVSFEEIKCKRNLQLIFKSSDNSPACVTSSTAEKLIERGWKRS